MLLENFESAYLDGVTQKIGDYSIQYRELYTACYDQIEGYSKSSVQSHLLGGLATINKAASGAASKIPIVNKSQINETLLEKSNRLKEFGSRRTEQSMEKLLCVQTSTVLPFIENINAINKLYNESMDLLFDKENIYFGLSESST